MCLGRSEGVFGKEMIEPQVKCRGIQQMAGKHALVGRCCRKAIGTRGYEPVEQGRRYARYHRGTGRLSRYKSKRLLRKRAGRSQVCSGALCSRISDKCRARWLDRERKLSCRGLRQCLSRLWKGGRRRICDWWQSLGLGLLRQRLRSLWECACDS